MDTGNPSIEIGCPQCGTVNRVPAERLAQGPACGRCKAPLFNGEPVALGAATFDAVVGRTGLPVIVDFWAPWCNPCKMIAPTLDKLAQENEGKLIVAKVNTDDHAEWMQKFGIQGIPTLLFVSGGKVVHRQVGALPERMLREVVAQFMEVIKQN